MSWTIKGEALQPLDATLRSLDSLRIESCSLKFSSLASDTLVWTARTDNATGAGTIIPAAGQVVELWNGSTRKFKGWATAPRIGMKSVTVTIEGPWWWMTRINLTQQQVDGTAATLERPAFHFATGNLATSITALLDRATTDLGCPFARGVVATMYDVPAITLANMDCASALAELLRWVPDAVAWFNYTASVSTTVPTLNISRRKTGLALGSMSAVAYTIGTAAVENCDRNIRSWWRDHRNLVRTDLVLFLEYDVLCNIDLRPVIPLPEAARGIAGPRVMSCVTDGRSYWPFRDIGRLPREMQGFAIALTPLAARN